MDADDAATVFVEMCTRLDELIDILAVIDR